MRNLIALGVAFSVVLPFEVAGQQAGMSILSKNPQLSQIQDWPKPTGVGEPVDCSSDLRQVLDVAAMRRLGQPVYRCLVVQGAFGGQAWEVGGGGMALYQLQLHPNSPMVWRVFKRDENRVIALVGEFDETGKLTKSQSARSPTELWSQPAQPPKAAHASRRAERKLTQCDRDPSLAHMSDAELTKRYNELREDPDCKRARTEGSGPSLAGRACHHVMGGLPNEMMARGLVPTSNGKMCK